MTDTATGTQSKHWSQCQQPCWGTNTALAFLLPVSVLHPQHQAAQAEAGAGFRQEPQSWARLRMLLGMTKSWCLTLLKCCCFSTASICNSSQPKPLKAAQSYNLGFLLAHWYLSECSRQEKLLLNVSFNLAVWRLSLYSSAMVWPC